jgi:RNA polymerase sigma factor (TIGR02999 family)
MPAVATLPEAVASLILAADGGDGAAAGQLFSSLYRELHRVAAHQLRVGAPNSTLGATTLLHECYLNLSGSTVAFPDRARFISYASRAMRGLIIDHIRERRALKRGGEFHLTTLNTQTEESVPLVDEMTRLNEALSELEVADKPLAELVDLKFFCGFSFADIAAMREVSVRTVNRDWQKAKLYLHGVLAPE